MGNACSAADSYLCVLCSSCCGCACGDDHDSTPAHDSTRRGAAAPTTRQCRANNNNSNSGNALLRRQPSSVQPPRFSSVAIDVVLPPRALSTSASLPHSASRVAAVPSATATTTAAAAPRAAAAAQKVAHATDTPTAFALRHVTYAPTTPTSVIAVAAHEAGKDAKHAAATTDTNNNNNNNNNKDKDNEDDDMVVNNALSFTNSFADVNETAVTTFLRGIAQLSSSQDPSDALQHSILTATMQHPRAMMQLLRQPLLTARADDGSGGGGGSREAGAGHGTAGDAAAATAADTFLTPDALQHIAHGGPPSETLQRLCEVEYAAREQLVATCTLYSQLLYMAAARIVPTLRTRRTHDTRSGGGGNNAVSTVSGSGSFAAPSHAAAANEEEPLAATAMSMYSVADMSFAAATTTAPYAAAAAANKKQQQQLSLLQQQQQQQQSSSPPQPQTLLRPVLVIHAHDLRLESPRSLSASQSLEAALPLPPLQQPVGPAPTAHMQQTRQQQQQPLSSSLRTMVQSAPTTPTMLSRSQVAQPQRAATPPAAVTPSTTTAADANAVQQQQQQHRVSTERMTQRACTPPLSATSRTDDDAVATAPVPVMPTMTSSMLPLPYDTAALTTVGGAVKQADTAAAEAPATTAMMTTSPPSSPLLAQTRVSQRASPRMSPLHSAPDALSMSAASAGAPPRATSPPRRVAELPQQQPQQQQQQSQQQQQASATVEHLEMLALSCRDVSSTAKVNAVVEARTWDFLAKEALVQALNRGDCIFRFMCMPASALDEESLELIDTFINVSAFADEQAQNNVPIVHIRSAEEQQRYIVILVKAMYMLPHVRISDVTAPIIASYDYQRACQPSSNKVEQTDIADTFRITSTIIKFIFSITVQFKVSEVTSPAVLQSFKRIDGLPPARALVLERTKRHIYNTDATAKVRSMLLYYPVNGGVLVDNVTIVLNTSLPTVASKILNTFGSQGASQSADTARLTRQYFAKRCGKL